MRMPFLLGGSAHEPEQWNQAVVAADPPYGLSEELYATHLRGVQFPHDMWVKSPCFWWQPLKSDNRLNGLFFRGGEWARVLFCEDLSRFESSDSTKTGAPLEFAAELEGAWSRRHVGQVKGRHYTPKSRLAK